MQIKMHDLVPGRTGRRGQPWRRRDLVQSAVQVGEYFAALIESPRSSTQVSSIERPLIRAITNSVPSELTSATAGIGYP
jgi:hypothetical protein